MPNGLSSRFPWRRGCVLKRQCARSLAQRRRRRRRRRVRLGGFNTFQRHAGLPFCSERRVAGEAVFRKRSGETCGHGNDIACGTYRTLEARKRGVISQASGRGSFLISLDRLHESRCVWAYLIIQIEEDCLHTRRATRPHGTRGCGVQGCKCTGPNDIELVAAHQPSNGPCPSNCMSNRLSDCQEIRAACSADSNCTAFSTLVGRQGFGSPWYQVKVSFASPIRRRACHLR